jgi:hypothetical protein
MRLQVQGYPWQDESGFRVAADASAVVAVAMIFRIKPGGCRGCGVFQKPVSVSHQVIAGAGKTVIKAAPCGNQTSAP